MPQVKTIEQIRADMVYWDAVMLGHIHAALVSGIHGACIPCNSPAYNFLTRASFSTAGKPVKGA